MNLFASIRFLFYLVWCSSTAIIITNALVFRYLDGDDWNVFDSDKHSSTIPGRVPGSIYSDLERIGILNESIYKDFNDVEYRWVAHRNWTYVKTFDVENEVLNHPQIYLVCHGLDTISNVYLNGHLLGSTDNMFVRYRWPVKNLIKPKQNLIQVSFVSPIYYSRKRFIEYPITVPPVSVPQEQRGEDHVNFIRKMQASFSWDWGPAFPTEGIWQPIVIESYDNVMIRSLSVDTIFEQHSGQWLLNVTVWMESKPGNRIQANLTLYLDDQFLVSKEFQADFNNYDGEGSTNIFLMVPIDLDVKPWFPNGVGEQNLYRLNATIETNHEITSKEVMIGFRTIELVQDKLNASVEAYSFYFKVNGFPIYSKGSNWIPAHVLTEKVSKEYLAYLLWSAKEANMNMLRVWGGGIYETDYFYQLADEYGILIWQDMMFACALYPTDDQFLSSVSKEIRQQIRRLHHHPSIALWAGNNENEMALAQGWWSFIVVSDPKRYRQDYLKLYVETIMPIVLQEDKSRPFLTSSPTNGIVSPRDNYLSVTPNDNRYGDVHFYDFLNDAWQWKTFPSTKFASEYGYQSLPSLGLLQKYLSMDYLKYPIDKGLDHRQHKMNGNSFITSLLSKQLPLPSNSSRTIQNLNDYIYLVQIFQSMAIKTETEFYRRNRPINTQNGEGFTMGALYWQLNNIWPGYSWSSIEYEGKWKMAHYYVKKIFDNLLVDVYRDENLLKIVIVRDDFFNHVNFTIDIKIYEWSKQNLIYQSSASSVTSPFDATLSHVDYIPDLLSKAKCPNPDQCFAYVDITGIINGNTLKRNNFLFFGNLKNAKLIKNPMIKLINFFGPTTDMGSYMYELELSTNAIVPFVWLDFDPAKNIFAVFSDNGFLMINQTKIQFRTTKKFSKETIITGLIIKTLNDLVI